MVIEKRRRDLLKKMADMLAQPSYYPNKFEILKREVEEIDALLAPVEEEEE